MTNKISRLKKLPDEALAELFADMGREAFKDYIAPKETVYPTEPSDFIRDTLGVSLWQAQEDVITSVRDNRFTVVEAGNSVGKCVRISQEIFLSDGSIVTAGSLIGKTFSIIGYDPKNWEMRPMFAYAEDNGEQPIVKVTLASGRVIERTLNHPLLTWDGWQLISNLEVGDRVAIPIAHPYYGTKSIPEDELKLLAYIIADGNVTKKNTCVLTKAPGPVRDEMEQVIRNLGCTPVKRAGYNIACTKNVANKGQAPNPIAQLVSRYGLSLKKSSAKTIPEQIWTIPKSELCLFLNRLYSCDGWIYAKSGSNPRCRHKIEVGYSSTSYPLAQGVFYLLLRLGISARIDHKFNKKYQVDSWTVCTIDSQSTRAFFDTVGYPLGKEKQCLEAEDTLRKISSGKHPRSRDYDLLPKSAWESFVGKYKYRKFGFRVIERANPSRMIVRRYEEITGLSMFGGWSDSKIGFDTITKIEQVGTDRTVAICVPETGCYATTVIEHNSFCAAAVACWWLSTHKEAIVLSTAPTWNQVASILWREIRSHSQKSKVSLPGRVLDTPRWEIAADRYGLGVSTRKSSDEDLTSMLGYHSPHLLVIMDEAAGLPRAVWQTVARLVTGENNRVLAIGNPIAQEGPFYEATQNKSWKHIRISCLDHPNVVQDQDIIPGAVSRRWVLERISEWGYPCEPNTPGGIEVLGHWIIPLAVFYSSVLGVPPSEREDQLIPFQMVSDAKVLWHEIEPSTPRVLGVDPARFGSAKTAVALRCGDKVMWVKRREGQDATQVAGWIHSLMLETDAEVIKIDEIGIGAGITDILRRSWPVEGVNFARSAQQKHRFANLRSETYWNVRTALRRGKLALPDDSLLTGDLTAIRFSYDMHGRVELELKDNIEKRLGRSVDSGDAVALTLANVQMPVDDDTGGNARLYKDMTETLVREGGSPWVISGKRVRGGSRWRS